MIRVQVRPNEPLEAALRRFKRQCNYAGIFRLAKKHAYHEKSSDKRRREGRERERNIMMAERKRQGVSGGRSKKRRTRGGKGKERRDNQPDFDPLTADTTLDTKAASEAAANTTPGSDAAKAPSAAPAAAATPSES
ncbi:MAG: 30S ribosomal protein S21 [Planctomycetota bacterium]